MGNVDNMIEQMDNRSKEMKILDMPEQRISVKNEWVRNE